jgi:hypothetical protein
MEEGKAIQDYLKKKTGQKTVPNIFISRFTSLKYLAPFSFLLCRQKTHRWYVELSFHLLGLGQFMHIQALMPLFSCTRRGNL